MLRRIAERIFRMKKTLLFVAAAILAVSQCAYAVTIGANELLGVIVPGTPANGGNEQIMVNGLLEGWAVPGPDVLGYKDGARTGSFLGNNPNDPQYEGYTLKFSASTVLPSPGSAPLATSNSGNVETSTPTFNLGAYTYDWVLAKWGQSVAVYYIGNLTAGTQVTLSLGGTGFSTYGHGLSHYVLFNQKTSTVPDGGSTAALLGSVLVAFGMLRRRFGQK
jgi:hypothetical protein